MKKLLGLFQTIKDFVNGVIGEVIKSSWPSREELIESTIVVIISVIMLGLFVGVSDKILAVILRLLIPTRVY